MHQKTLFEEAQDLIKESNKTIEKSDDILSQMLKDIETSTKMAWNAGYQIATQEIENRLLPDGFSCVLLTDGSLAIYKPKEANVFIDNKHDIVPSNK